MEKIIFTLNNTGIHHTYSALSFVTFELLLSNQDSGARAFMNAIGFKEDDFHKLYVRIQINNDKEVAMNEGHLIIFYAVVHFACAAFVDEKERKILVSFYDKDKLHDMEITRKNMLDFGTVVSEKLRREYGHSEKAQKGYRNNFD